jgi:putative intracellular protease/amidase
MHDTVHLYIYPGFADWEAAFAVAGIQTPEFQQEPGRWQVRTVAASSREPVRSAGNMHVLPDLTLHELEPSHSALLIVPGGPGWEDAHGHAEVMRTVQGFVDAGVPVAAICGATAGLARAGLLDTRQHTSNALAYLKGTGYRGSDRYCDVPAVNDGGLITAGGMSAIDFARAIFDELGVYDDEVLAAWYDLYKNGRSASFATMREAAQATA